MTPCKPSYAETEVGRSPSGRAVAPSASSRSVSPVPASIPSAGIEVIGLPAFHARLHAQGVADRNHNAFVCPICGTVQSMASLVEAGATAEKAESIIGFSCEGRLTKAGPFKKANAGSVRGCDWSLGGLFRLHKLEVDDGARIHPLFELATAEQAQALASAIEVRRAETAQTGSVHESAVAKPDAQGASS